MVEEVAFYRTYLHQHGRRVFVTGVDDLLITGVPEGRVPRAPRPDAA